MANMSPFINRLMFFMFVTCPILLPANQVDAGAIIGKWQFKGIILKDEYQDRPNPNLILTYEFLADGTDIMRWTRLNEKGFCERRGEWYYDEGHLHDKVVWINPDNNMDCGSDPDMKLGKETVNPMWREGNQLFLELPFSDDVILYVWDLLAAQETD